MRLDGFKRDTSGASGLGPMAEPVHHCDQDTVSERFDTIAITGLPFPPEWPLGGPPID